MERTEHVKIPADDVWFGQVRGALREGNREPLILADLPSSAILALVDRLRRQKPRAGATSKELADTLRHKLRGFLEQPMWLAILMRWREWYDGIRGYPERMKELRDGASGWREAARLALTYHDWGSAPAWMRDALLGALRGVGTLRREQVAALETWREHAVADYVHRRTLAEVGERVSSILRELSIPAPEGDALEASVIVARLRLIQQRIDGASASVRARLKELVILTNQKDNPAFGNLLDEGVARPPDASIWALETVLVEQGDALRARLREAEVVPAPSRVHGLTGLLERLTPPLQEDAPVRTVLAREAERLATAPSAGDEAALVRQHAPMLSALAHLLGDEEAGLTSEGALERLAELSYRFVSAVQQGHYSLAPLESSGAPHGSAADATPEAAAVAATSVRVETMPDGAGAWSALEPLLEEQEPDADEPESVEPSDPAPESLLVPTPLSEERPGPHVAPVEPSDPSLRSLPTGEERPAPVADLPPAPPGPAPVRPPAAKPPERVWVELDAVALHASAGASTPKTPLPPLGESTFDAEEGLVERLIAAGRLELACHGAVALEAGQPKRDWYVSGLLRGALAGLALRSPYGPAAEELHDAISELQAAALDLDNLERHRDLVAVLLLGATAKAALLAPSTRARDLLQVLPASGTLSWMHSIRSAILELTVVGDELSPSVLKGIAADDAWQTDLRSDAQACEAWLEKQASTSVVYAPASKVWQTLAAREGELGSLMAMAATGRIDLVPQIRQGLLRWPEERDADHVRRTDRELRGPVADRKAIEARALRKLCQHIAAARAQLERFCDLATRRPARDQYIVKRVLQIRPKVLHELSDERLTVLSAGGAVSAVASLVRDALIELFDPAAHQREETSATAALADAALLLPGVPLAQDGMPQTGHERALLTALSDPRTVARDEAEAFEMRLRERNHDASRRLLERIRAKQPEMDVSDLERKRDRALHSDRLTLQNDVEVVRDMVAEAMASELLPASRCAQFGDEIGAIASRLQRGARAERNGIEDVGSAQRLLLAIQRELQAARDRSVQLIRAGLATAELEARTPGSTARIDALLDRGELLAAKEYIDLAGRGAELPEDRPYLFDTFFPGFVERWSQNAQLGKLRAQEIPARLAIGDTSWLEGFACEAEPRDAGRAIDSWVSLARRNVKDLAQREAIPARIAQLLEQFGFGRPQAQSSDFVGQEAWLGKVQVEPIANGVICPVPRFGSQAAGRYSILAVWGQLRDEALRELIQRFSGDTLIVLHFGVLAPSRRREIAKFSRDSRLAFILIDEALAVFLALQRERLSSLFICALPFTSLQPYVTSAGTVPDELFVGRKDELQSVLEPTGTNLVYGGRQLGKTALLKHAERRFHNVRDGRIVRFIDLKYELSTRSLNDLWQVIAAKLTGDVPKLAPDIRTHDTLWKHLGGWLREDPSRQIVLLLDESDTFLAMDRSSEWRTVLTLKGWMDETARHFKVVFAGLHDVQRTSRDVNTPLAHFGAPVCIGPLLQSREVKAALDLVERPLRALGYKFEGAHVPLRLLAQANYYPSLLQLICYSLVEHLTQRAHFEIPKTPPYVVTAEHLKGASEGNHLRRQVLERFRWTLDLDPRYRVLALLIAWETMQRRNEGDLTHAGFRVESLRDEVLAQWSGYEGERSIETFRTVLDEMIGLGLLRSVSAGAYALRNDSVLNLFGTSEEIFDELTDALAHPPRQEEKDPAWFRRQVATASGRSVLTAQQESALCARDSGTAVVFGTQLGGLEHAYEHLMLGARARIELADLLPGPRSLPAYLEQVYNPRDEWLLIVVPPHTRWTVETVEDANAFISRRRGSSRVRLVFLGDPNAAWRFGERLEHSSVSVHTLRPWSPKTLHTWIDEELEGQLRREEVSALTGGWSEPIRELRERLGDDKLQWSDRVARLQGDDAWKEKWKRTLAFPQECQGVLAALTEWNDLATPEELAQAAELPPELVARVFAWAERIGVLTVEPHSKWMMDSFVRELLVVDTCP